jgi:hypothetical protein
LRVSGVIEYDKNIRRENGEYVEKWCDHGNILRLGMELAQLDGQVDRNMKKESPAPSTKSTQNAERASTLLSETHRSAERSTDSISESEYLHDEVKQAKDPCRET